MGHVVCFDRAEQARHQDRSESADEAAERINALTVELTAGLQVLFLSALNGHPVGLPYVSRGHFGIPDQERADPVWHALGDHIEDAPAALVQAVFSKSECPHVKALKVAMANAYAERWAERLAEVRA